MNAKKRVRRTKEQIEAEKANKKPMKGLGDVVEKIAEATGIKSVVKFVAGEDCGCDERKEFLNNLFPFNKPNCLNEDEFQYLDELFSEAVFQLVPSQQSRLLEIYQRVFNEKRTQTTCPDCWRDILNKLKQVHETYKDGEAE